MTDYPEDDFDGEQAFEQDRKELQKKYLDSLFALWRIAFMYGPLTTTGSRSMPGMDALAATLAEGLGLSKEWERSVDAYLFRDNE